MHLPGHTDAVDFPQPGGCKGCANGADRCPPPVLRLLLCMARHLGEEEILRAALAQHASLVGHDQRSSTARANVKAEGRAGPTPPLILCHPALVASWN